MRAVAYLRVSTDKQAKDGLSLNAQHEKLRAMAIVRGDELVEIIVDGGESAKSLKREGVQRLLGMIKAGAVDAVIVCKLDRLTRSLRDLSDILEIFDKHNVSLVSLAESLDTKSASGRLVLNIMTAVSQWEREAIGERTKAVLDYKRARGERLGNIPYGWKDNGQGTLLWEKEEQLTIRTLKSLKYNMGGKATNAYVARELNRMGNKTRCGGEWRREYVARILKSA